MQVITVIDMWLFLLCPLFSFILEEREISFPQRSKWYFRLRSSWECGGARTWLQGPVEDRRCGDGSALRRWPGGICHSTRRPPDASSQGYDVRSGCSHPRSLANSLPVAAFCRWEVYLRIYPTKTARLPFRYEVLCLLPPSECCWPLESSFSVTGPNLVRQTQIPKSWPHLPSHNLLCWLHIYKEGYGKMVSFLLVYISRFDWQFPFSLNPEITYVFSKQLQMHPTAKDLTLQQLWAYEELSHCLDLQQTISSCALFHRDMNCW